MAGRRGCANVGTWNEGEEEVDAVIPAGARDEYWPGVGGEDTTPVGG